MLLIYLSTVDKYDIVYDMDSSIPQGSLHDNDGGDSTIFAGMMLFIIVVLQALVAYFEKSRGWKWIAGIMAVVAAVFFVLRI